MEKNFDDGGFWLPPQILADDGGDMFEEKLSVAGFNKQKKNDEITDDAFGALFPSEFPYGVVSPVLSSPVESLVGSSETESDEEEHHMAELTRRMAHSTLDFDSEFQKSKGSLVSGSPQSILCAFSNECGECRKVPSSHGSPNDASQVSSPKATWDLLHAAAGEVERMKMKQQEDAAFDFLGIFGPLRKPSPVTLPSKITNPDVGFYNQPSLSHQQQQLQIAQFQMLRQQQMMKAASGSGFYQQRQQHSKMVPNGRNNNARPVNLSSPAWPPLQQKPQQQFGSGMRAVFLENPAGKRECAGTGVFLPRRVNNNHTDSRRKSGCSTVLVPARVMQALNLKVENMVGGQPQYQPRFNGSSTVGKDAHFLPRVRNDRNHSHQRRHLRPPPQPPVNNEIRLPQEWTY